MTVSRVLIKSISDQTKRHITLWAKLTKESNFLSNSPSIDDLLDLIVLTEDQKEIVRSDVYLLLAGQRSRTEFNERVEELCENYKLKLEDAYEVLNDHISNIHLHSINSIKIDKSECISNPKAMILFKRLVSLYEIDVLYRVRLKTDYTVLPDLVTHEESLNERFDQTWTKPVEINKTEIVCKDFDSTPLIKNLDTCVYYRELLRTIKQQAIDRRIAESFVQKVEIGYLPQSLRQLLFLDPERIWQSQELKKEFGDKFQRPNNLPIDKKFQKTIDRNISRLADKFPDKIKLNEKKARTKTSS